MKLFFLFLLVAAFGISAMNFNSDKNHLQPKDNLCSYVDKPVRSFLIDLKDKIKDTIPTKQYSGHLTSFYLRTEKGYSYEIFPVIPYNDSLYYNIRDSFNLKLLEEVKIKSIKLSKNGKTIKVCKK